MTLSAEPFVSKPVDPKTEPHAPRFSKTTFLRMVESGVFDDRCVSLFRGELIQMPAMGWEHVHGLRRTSNWANDRLRPKFEVLSQSPLDVSEESVPEPDLVICNLTAAERRPLPRSVELVIEIADTSIALDRAKAMEYAIVAPEYWILDVRHRVLHVYRNPHDDAAGLYGKVFDAPTTHAEADSIAPLCDPAAIVTVRDLLPPA